MTASDQYRARRCMSYFIFTVGTLMISVGLISIGANERAAVYGIATGIIVLLVGLFSVGRGLREDHRPHPSAAISNTEDLPPAYRNTWRKTFLEECRLSSLTQAEPPPTYRDSWSKGVSMMQGSGNTRAKQSDHILVLNPSTLTREVARTSALNHNVSESSESGRHSNTFPQNETTFVPHPSPIRKPESEWSSADSNNAPSLDRMRAILSTVTPAQLPGGGRNNYSLPPPSVMTSDFQANERVPSVARMEEDEDLAVVTPSQLHRIFEYRMT